MNLELLMGGALTGTRIAGVGKYLPEHYVTNGDLARIVDTSDEWIRQRTGIERRAILDNPKWATSDMAAAASREALYDAGVKPKNVQGLILATTTPDYLIPATAPVVADMIGMGTPAYAFDINAACTGFVYALNVANALIKSGSCDNALVVASDTFSRRVNGNDRGSCILFGDGAGAVLVSKADGPVMPMYFDLGSDGGKWRLLNVPSGGARNPLTAEGLKEGEDKLQMQGRDLSPIAVRAMSDSVRRVLKKANIPLSRVDYIVPHQMNLRMIETLAGTLGRREKCDLTEAIIRVEEIGTVVNYSPRTKILTNIHRVGNTSAASIPVLLAEADQAGIIHPNQLLLLPAAGAGLTFGAGLLKWKEDSNEPTPLKVFDRFRNLFGTLAPKVFHSIPFTCKPDSIEGEK